MTDKGTLRSASNIRSPRLPITAQTVRSVVHSARRCGKTLAELQRGPVIRLVRRRDGTSFLTLEARS